MPKASTREESGAQLLARLGSRPDLSCVDPYLFNCHRPHPTALSASASKSHAQSTSSKGKSVLSGSCSGCLVEIFGPEGAGKTELALHYLAKVCLPQSQNGVRIGGVGAKAVLVDTELKFSVLRLAVIMEKQILALHQARGAHWKSTPFDSKLDKQLCEDKSEVNETKRHEKNFKLTSEENKCFKSERRSYGLQNLPHSSCNSGHTCNAEEGNLTKSTSDSNSKTERRISVTSCVKQEDDGVFHTVEEESEEKSPSSLTPEDLESIVQEALGRVQVVKPNNPQQLFMTLLSLETALASDLQTTLVVLDSVSAFFWENCLAENAAYSAGRTKFLTKGGNSSNSAVGGMALVARVLGRLVSELGMTVIMTKAPLVGGVPSSSSNSSATNRKRKWQGDKEEEDARNESFANSTSTISATEETFVDDDHVEFLGKAWTNLNSRRIVLVEESASIGSCVSRTVSSDSAGTQGLNDPKRVISASSSLWPCKRRFTFVDDALQFL